MALSFSMTEAVGRLLTPGMRVAALGYPDIVAPLPIIESIIGEHFRGLEYRKDSEAICKRHNLAYRQIPDAASFFKLRGATLDVFDIVQERGCEILCDLNTEIFDKDWRARRTCRYSYDMVLDVGTLEHCFNVAQAAFNMANLVTDGGYIIHENPFNWGNHGFYNLNPTWYADFYKANGFELLECRLALKELGADVPLTKRFVFNEREANVFAVARRVAVVPSTYPMQSKYAKSSPAAGVPGEQTKEVANA